MDRKILALLLSGLIIYGVSSSLRIDNSVISLQLGFVGAEKLSFSGKVIIVTGASSGIGADAAIHLAKLGASVSLVGRNENRLKNVSAEIENAGAPTPLILKADVTKDAQRIVNETVKHFGKLNILINSAGISMISTPETIEMSDYDLIMNTNVRSIVELMKYSIPHLKKTKGNIVNIASIYGIQGPQYGYVYSVSKAAVIQLTKSAAREIASSGIRINAVAPGITRTRMAETALGSSSAADKFYDKNAEVYPLGRVGEVSDISAAIEYLAGDVASFVTGTVLTVDGGALAANIDIVY